MMKPAILFVEQQSWRAGAQRVLETVLDALDDEFHPWVAFPGPGPFQQSVRRRGMETATYPLGAYRAGQKSVVEMAEFGIRSMVCGLRLAALIVRRNIALVYVNGPRCLPAAALAARLTGRPCLFHLHMTLSRRGEILVASRAARWVTKIVACSHAAASSIIGACPDLAAKTQVIYNPVHEPDGVPADLAGEPRRKNDPEHLVVGMVGRITAAKGQDILLRAAATLGTSVRRNIRLVFVGAPGPGSPQDLSYTARLRTLAKELGLQDRIAWAGYQPDVRRWYAGMDVLVLLSIDQEGMPLVVLEALREGVPVVASRVGGVPEVVEGGVSGFLVPPGDVKALSRALRWLATDPALRARMSAAARASVGARFSGEFFRRAIRALVFELCWPTAPAPLPRKWRASAE